MRAVIYLVSGVLLGVLLLPAPLLDTFSGSAANPADARAPVPATSVLVSLEDQEAAARQAYVRGTNNVATDTLLQSGLAPDALDKRADLDGDGDPDVIHIRLEALPSTPWTLLPKAFGRTPSAVASSPDAQALQTLPDLHLEAGDRVLLTLENAHGVPVTLRFPGGDVLALTLAGLPVSRAPLVLPGATFTWLLHPIREGSARYEGRTSDDSGGIPHGQLIVTANLPDNSLQTLDVFWQAAPATGSALRPQPAPAPALNASQLLQLAGFGLALGLALAGLLGLLLPHWAAQLRQGAAP